jgi:hypothetical protein
MTHDCRTGWVWAGMTKCGEVEHHARLDIDNTLALLVRTCRGVFGDLWRRILTLLG